MYDNHSNIIAIATAPGKGSIGIVRISGKNLSDFSNCIFKRKLMPRQVYYLPFIDNNETIDRGVVIFFKSPNSYTGEDVIEMQCHGGIYITRLVLNMCMKKAESLNLRLAEPGEFTRRAFLNGKIDLTQAEAISDLISASSMAAVKSANISLSGKFSHIINNIQQQITQIRTITEANLDFSEEEINIIEKSIIIKKIIELKKEIKDLISQARQNIKIKDGIDVVLIGKPNVGKSSLLNKLAKEDISIVTPFAGTTRDKITKTIYIEGLQINLTDTAGIHKTCDPIEQAGIKRSLIAIKKADIILCVHDINRDDDFKFDKVKLPKYKTINVFNKIDLIKKRKKNDLKNSKHNIYISIKNSIGLENITKRILDIAIKYDSGEAPWLARKRHIECLKKAYNHLEKAYMNIQENFDFLEIFAEELRLTQNNLNYITGEFTNEDLLGKIFSDFCIGK